MSRPDPLRRARHLLSALRAAHKRDSQEWSRRVETTPDSRPVTRW